MTIFLHDLRVGVEVTAVAKSLELLQGWFFHCSSTGNFFSHIFNWPTFAYLAATQLQFKDTTAFFASFGFSKSTNPYPLHMPVFLSKITLVETIFPCLHVHHHNYESVVSCIKYCRTSSTLHHNSTIIIIVNIFIISTVWNRYTVKLPKRGHLRTSAFVLYLGINKIAMNTVL